MADKAPTKEELLKEHEHTGPHPTSGGAYTRSAGGDLQKAKPQKPDAAPATPAADAAKK